VGVRGAAPGPGPDAVLVHEIDELALLQVVGRCRRPRGHRHAAYQRHSVARSAAGPRAWKKMAHIGTEAKALGHLDTQRAAS